MATFNESRRPSLDRSNRTSLWNVPNAELVFSEIERLMKTAESGTPTERSKREERRELWRKTVSYLDTAASSFCLVNDAIPLASFPAQAFKTLTRWELARQDNCPQVVDQYHAIGRTLHMVEHFTDANVEDNIQVKQWMTDIGKLIEELGNFTNFYYAKRKHTIYCLWHAEKVRAKLEDFHRRLGKCRTDLLAILKTEDLLPSHDQFEESEKKWSELSERLTAEFGEPSTHPEAQASALIQKWGRDTILNDQEKLNDLTNILNEKVTTGLQNLLRSDIDELLQSRMEAFHRRFQSSISNLNEEIVQFQESSAQSLDAGPHELIKDPDIRNVWKMNNWKHSVKARHFIDALSNYFEERFRTTQQSVAPQPDAWTLPILTRVMHHPAIGDAIDEDGSGFISVHEIEVFSKHRPVGISLPEWLAYWAVGWRICNLKYNTEMLQSLEAIGEKCRKTARMSRVEDVRKTVRDYLSEVEAFRNIASWADPNDASDVSDVSFGSDGIQLQNLVSQVEELDIKETRKRWEDLEWKVEEPSDMLVLFHGHETRIEQHFLCISHVLLEHHRERIVNSTDLGDGDWSEMAETLKFLVNGFKERVRSLTQGWRAQKLDVERQVNSFAGGVCAGWYSMYGQSHRDTRKNMSFFDMSPGATPGAPHPQIVAAQLNDLGERVERLERLISDKMDAMQMNMASMLRDVLISDIMQDRIMGMGSPTTSVMTGPTNSTIPTRYSRPIINVDIPSVTFSDVVVNQNGSLHMNTPVIPLPDRRQRASTDTINARHQSISPSLTRSDSLGMSSFVQTASGRKYMGSYDGGTDEYSSEYAASSTDHTERIQSDPSEGTLSDAHASGLSDTQMDRFGLGTPTSMHFQSPQEQYYGGVMLISRSGSDPTPQLRIAPVEREIAPSSPTFSPPFLSAQSDAFMGRHAYDVPISAVPGTDTDSGRSARSSKASKQSVGSAGSASSSTSGGGGGFRGGLKSVKDSFRGIGGVNGIRKKTPSSFSSPTSGSVTPRPPQQQQQQSQQPQQQEIINVSAGPAEWYTGASTGILSPPPTGNTASRRSPNGTSPPAGSGFSRMVSPFAYMQKVTGSQTRVASPTSQYDAFAAGGGFGAARPSIGTSVRPFGSGTHQIGGGVSSAIGLGPAFGRAGHIAGPRSVDVATPARQVTRWPNARRSRSIDGLGL